jgi:hypothetical protein
MAPNDRGSKYWCDAPKIQTAWRRDRWKQLRLGEKLGSTILREAEAMTCYRARRSLNPDERPRLCTVHLNQRRLPPSCQPRHRTILAHPISIQSDARSRIEKFLAPIRSHDRSPIARIALRLIMKISRHEVELLGIHYRRSEQRGYIYRVDPTDYRKQLADVFTTT